MVRLKYLEILWKYHIIRRTEHELKINDESSYQYYKLHFYNTCIAGCGKRHALLNSEK